MAARKACLSNFKGCRKLILLKGTGFRACVRSKKETADLSTPLQPVPFVPRISPTETLSNGSCRLGPPLYKEHGTSH
jgi:hypothetical protein